MIIRNENILVCFVNTDQKPKKIKRLGHFKYVQNGNLFRVFELCEIWYPHPEATEDASISLLNWLPVEFQIGTLNLIKSAIDAVNDIKSITELIGISEETKVI